MAGKSRIEQLQVLTGNASVMNSLYANSAQYPLRLYSNISICAVTDLSYNFIDLFFSVLLIRTCFDTLLHPSHPYV